MARAKITEGLIEMIQKNLRAGRKPKEIVANLASQSAKAYTPHRTSACGKVLTAMSPKDRAEFIRLLDVANAAAIRLGYERVGWNVTAKKGARTVAEAQ